MLLRHRLSAYSESELQAGAWSLGREARTGQSDLRAYVVVMASYLAGQTTKSKRYVGVRNTVSTKKSYN